MSILSRSFIDWLTKYANQLDQSNQYSDELFTRLANDGVFKVGVPVELGGNGGDYHDVIAIIEELASYSLTAGFITWGHRTLIQNLIESTNPLPREKWLPVLLAGQLSGGTGLSNAVKFLSGIEELQVKIIEKNGKFYLQGKLPWITNVSKRGFITIFAAEYADNRQSPVIIALPHDATGVTRSVELELVGLQGSNTVALLLENVALNPAWIIADNASDYLAQIRPAFLSFQCAMAFGLAKRSLAEVEQSLSGNRSILEKEWQAQSEQLQKLRQSLQTGLAQIDYFVQQPQALFQIRNDIIEVASQSVLLELQASGGRGYLKKGGSNFIRRWREAAFLPVVTPSVVQLKTILQQH
ncbi:alkylation response protein AidB-like acyl-CoA dehydrogenase [Nicoletella semolina]|uniref:Alkylation response protein AidB-like acyl-CoA dehydrogenase n=1 Tax=Nicoletella semolina TaxID=271160 RepID=A0A4R2NBS3_9PAST|nr:acyl-CoA dehydrogenase family protein [Nicoletella semolina]MDH2924920.1 dehydrogenase [Nicoletella semolina]TCP18465.1 alkylation response protein AidB-like acyl-CoA dehydrogenase [Nicoletella semolina]